MKARVAGVAGSVLALTVIGGFAAASTFQSAPVAPVRVVQPAVVATVAPVAVVQPAVVATVAPVVAPTTQAPVVVAPAPVVSTQAPVVVAPKPKVVTVPKVVASAPAPAWTPPVQTPGKGPNLADDPNTTHNVNTAGGATSTPATPAPAP